MQETAHPGAQPPHIRLRIPTPTLIGLPWERPLEEWPDSLSFRRILVGPSRHLVRFLAVEGTTYALKSMPAAIAAREFDVLTHLERLGLPAVRPVGFAELPDGESATLVTEYLAHSMQYRRVFMRLPVMGAYADRLRDAGAWLLVDLHRAGVFWGDCSLANTLFRRDGDKLQAYLVDAETAEVHLSLTDGQRMHDLEILVENVAYGLADLAAMQGRDDDPDEAIAAAESVRERYLRLWAELTEEPYVAPADRFAMTARIRRLNDLGFSVDEMELVPSRSRPGEVRIRVAVTTRQFHARELASRTGIEAMEGQARLLLNDLREYRMFVEAEEGTGLSRDEAGRRWLAEVYGPTLARLEPALGPTRDRVQAYCDVLEAKWLLSERESRDVGLERAVSWYLEQGAPAPESRGVSDDTMVLDLEGLDDLDEPGVGG